jgi:predicted acylesterase/phospholipase RssA
VTPSYDNLIMQGGGIRCLWQAGFLSAVAPHWDRKPGKIFAVSAGAAIACAFAADRLDAGVEAFREAVSRNKKNFYPSHLLSRKPAFPHAAMYRALLSDVLNDSGMKALQRGPDVEILLCRPPRRLSAVTVKALLLGIGLSRRFSATKNISSTLIRTSGLSPEFVSVRSCLDARGVTDLVLASSSTPPFTPLFSYQGRHALDGGVLESIPMSGLRPAGARALVILTSPHHPQMQQASFSPRSGVAYVAPSRHVAGAPWDYANPRLLDAFYSLGKENGARFVETEAL